MTNTRDEYIAQLNELKFSDDAKTRMAERLAATTPTAAANTGLAPVRDTKVVMLSRTSRTKHAWWKIAAATAAVALAVGAGTSAAVAAGLLPAPSAVFADIFYGAQNKADVVNKIGYPIGASCSSNGVTITAAAAIGDQYSYSIIFDIAKDDGSAFDLAGAETSGTLNPNVRTLLLGASDVDLSIDGMEAASWGFYFYDADESDNAIQMVWQIHSEMTDNESIIGRPAHFHMSKLMRYDYPEQGTDGEINRVTLAEGDWNLDFEMNYEDTSLEIAKNLTTTFTTQDETDLTTGTEGTTQEHSVTVNKAIVSYVGITVEYTVDDVSFDDWNASLEASAGNQAYQIKADTNLWDFPVQLTLTDGTVIDMTSAMRATSGSNDGKVCISAGGTFERIIETSEIASIKLGDNTIDMSTIAK